MLQDNVGTAGRKVSVVLPCRNEELALQSCLDKIKATIAESGLDAEVIVVDNGSTDGSGKILEANLKTFPELAVVNLAEGGYGLAYLAGFERATGDCIFMADADGTYDFGDIPRFLEEIRRGRDLVIGNRFAQTLSRGSMSALHRAGNFFLSLVTRTLFKIEVRDIHCGERMVTREALSRITLYTAGMEFASEMIVKAARGGLSISELPVSYRPRLGESKLETYADGWRHLRFLLLYSPLFTFMLPGLILFLVGGASMAALYLFELRAFGLQLYVHPMFLSSLMVLVGYQLILFAGFSKVYAVTHLGDQSDAVNAVFRYVTIEKAGLAGVALALAGAAIYAYIFAAWVSSGFGSLDEIKNSVVALTLVALGVETFFSAFMLSTLGIKER